MGIHSQQPHGVVVIMVPFPCQSHLNQLLHLSCLISSYKIPTHYACFATHIKQAKLRFSNTNNPQFSQIQFQEFPSPPFLSPPPNPNSHTKFPSHLQPSFESSLQLRQPLAELFQKISASARRVVIVHDTLMSYAVQDFASIPNAESYVFSPISAFYSYASGKLSSKSDAEFDELPEGLPSDEGCRTPEFQKLIDLQRSFLNFNSGSILNSCRAIEGPCVDLLANLDTISSKTIWAIGPLNIGKGHDKEKSKVQHKCLEWLDKQAPNSVIYVSFGTTTSMTCEEIKELALGLEQSGQKFIWVLRDADKGNVIEGGDDRVELPKGYEERVQEIGMIVREWAPQLQILGHPSTGGFMSHCGWNSCLESISMGVPIAAWPMHSDQPKNAFFVTDILKAGLVLNKWENRNNLVTSSTIAKVVKCLIASKQGEEIRKRAEELGGSAREAVEDGGASLLELDSFISHVLN